MSNATLDALVQGAEDIDDGARALLQHRALGIIRDAEDEAGRAETWDSALFTAGLACNLLTTVCTAINMASWSPEAATAIGVFIMVMSSLATGAMGFRERLKFKDVAVLARALSCKLQRAVVLFVAGAKPYAHVDRRAAFVELVSDVERLKLKTDQERLRLRMQEDELAGSASETVHPTAPPATPDSLDSTGVARL